MSARRRALFNTLREYVEELETTGIAWGLIVDGSFTTAKPEPNDIDLILILPEHHDFTTLLRPFKYNILSRRRVAQRYAFDLLVARAHSVELNEYVEFFQRIRGVSDRRKGLLQVLL